MKTARIIVDTGPLVAFLNKNDKYHDWTVPKFSKLSPPFYTCEAVLSEACFLLGQYELGANNILSLLERQLLMLPLKIVDEISALKKLINSYKNLPMSLADACLVRMSEQITDSIIFTLDSDFRIYRKNKRNIIPTIMPKEL